MEDIEERTRRGETRSWYRVPSKGVTASQQRIAAAVDNEDWQRVRHSMKGISTAEKIDILVDYFEKDNFSLHTMQGEGEWEDVHDEKDCDVCIRIDNYIKALCRGGQLEAGLGIGQLLSLGDHIRK